MNAAATRFTPTGCSPYDLARLSLEAFLHLVRHWETQ